MLKWSYTLSILKSVTHILLRTPTNFFRTLIMSTYHVAISEPSERWCTDAGKVAQIYTCVSASIQGIQFQQCIIGWITFEIILMLPTAPNMISVKPC